jgi:uncharacterized ferritin-like protein (DUF455 family)
MFKLIKEDSKTVPQTITYRFENGDRNFTNKEWLEIISENCTAIKYIKNPTEEIQIEAVRKYWAVILSIDNPSEKVKQKALDSFKNNFFKITSMELLKFQYINLGLDIKEFFKNNPDFESELISICEENLDYYNKHK